MVADDSAETDNVDDANEEMKLLNLQRWHNSMNALKAERKNKLMKAAARWLADNRGVSLCY